VKGIFSRESGEGLGFNVDEVVKSETLKKSEKERVDSEDRTPKQRLKIVK
jgi:stringent starvation protein B